MAFWNADDDILIHYELYGDAPGKETLLLLPGLLGSIGSQWRAFTEPLSGVFRVVLTDLRGHGRSETRDLNLLPERMVQDLLGLLDYLGADNFHVAGYDWGGYLGLMIHLTQPRRVSTLLMHATKFYWTKEAATRVQQQLDPDKMGKEVPQYASQLAIEHGASRWRALVRESADLIGYLVDNGLRESMASQAQCPVLVSVGDRDELVSLQEAQRLSRLFSRGALLVLPEVNHPFKTVSLIPLLPSMKAFHRS